jgi:DNA polymerase I
MTEAAERKKLVVIDGKSVFYRGYYAMPNLATKDGTPTGGVFGFASMALEVVRKLQPDYVAVAWDKPKTNIRKRLELYPAYKAGRKPAPPDFYDQIPMLHELLEAFGWPLYELDDYEADDIMGTLAHQAGQQNIDTLLVTSDMDLLQVVNEHTKVFALKKGLSNIELYSPESFTAKYGIEVTQFLDLKALKGDSSDNIPGVPGIGEKGAVQLLTDHQTLDGIYENIDLIKETLRKKLVAGKDSAYLSKQLASIWIDAPIKLNLEEVDGSKADPEEILHLLQKLEFKSLVRQLPQIMQIDESSEVVASPHTPGFKTGKLVVVDSTKQLEDIAVKTSDPLIIHSRCAGKHGRKPTFIVFSDSSKTTYVLDVAKLGKGLKPWLQVQLAGAKLVGYDIKSTLQVLIGLGIDLPEVKHDVLIGAFVINSLLREQSLTELATNELDYEASPLEDVDDEGYVHRAAELIAIIRGLHEKQAKTIKETPKFSELVRDVEWPAIPVLARMEYEGIELDTEYLGNFAAEIDDAVSDLAQQIYGFADEEFNISSPAQLAKILFENLELPSKGIKKGKTGFSTAASELDKLRGQHPIVDLITQYREVTKLKNTYVDTLPLQVDEKSRVHTTYSLTIAQTGRLSSNDPNLQNIPVRTDLGRRIRTAFVAGKGKSFVSADYSQFELRLAAVMAGDKELVEMFNNGTDVHAATAAQVHGREPEDVTKQMRSAAKVINFGILYGMSPHGLAVAANMTFEQAMHFINRYKELRKPLFDYMDSIKEQAKKDGYVETIFGRRRPMPDIHSSNFMIRMGAERAAINMPIQGTEADLMKLAMVAVQQRLDKEFPSANMLLQVHDSILVECNDKDTEDIAKLLKETMEQIYPKLPVKLDVDTSVGKNWGKL